MEILNITSEEFGIEVEARSERGDEETFCVQLADCKYRSDLGCWITTNDSDGDIDCDDYPDFDISEIIEAAEKQASENFKEKFTEEEIKFNCAINDAVVVMRIDKETDEVELVIEDCGHIGSYQTRYQETGNTFTCKKEALEYAEKFRTSDYQDCRGLYQFIQELNAKCF